MIKYFKLKGQDLILAYETPIDYTSKSVTIDHEKMIYSFPQRWEETTKDEYDNYWKKESAIKLLTSPSGDSFAMATALFHRLDEEVKGKTFDDLYNQVLLKITEFKKTFNIQDPNTYNLDLGDQFYTELNYELKKAVDKKDLDITLITAFNNHIDFHRNFTEVTFWNDSRLKKL